MTSGLKPSQKVEVGERELDKRKDGGEQNDVER